MLCVIIGISSKEVKFSRAFICKLFIWENVVLRAGNQTMHLLLIYARANKSFYSSKSHSVACLSVNRLHRHNFVIPP